jgi:hypothetical protein
MSSADADQIGQSLLDLSVVSTMSSDTVNDILGEVRHGAEAFVVAVIFAASHANPGV